MLSVSGAIFVALALHVGWLWSEHTKQARALASLQSPIANPPDGLRRVTADPAEQARLRAVRKVTYGLVTPWADLLDTLESVPHQSVALLSVEPSVSKRSIRVTAEARNADDMLAYWSALQQDSRLTAVVLVSHQVQQQAPGTPVRFQLQAGWGAAP
jgi:Tfp pilus assembly protein PilN